MGDTAITVICNNYDASSDEAQTQTVAPISYFVIGGARGTDDDPATGVRGDDLVSGVSFKDDLRGTVKTGKSYYKDTGDTKTSGNNRTTLTDELLTRGGWRDHTDGNRISTTRGDVIEVVYGNYKLIVKGRIDDGSGADNAGLSESFFDASGGHIAEGTSTGGTVLKCEWDDDDQSGCWKTLEQTDGGDKKVVHTGYYEREYHGETMTLDIGKGCDAVTYDGGASTAPAHTADKPDMQDHTYARSIDHREKYASFTTTRTISGSYKDHAHVTSSYRRSYGVEHVSALACVAFKDELLADKIEQTQDYEYRSDNEAGVVKCDIRTIGVHNTFEDGAHYLLWPYGVDCRVTTPLVAKMVVGLDTYYRCGPSADLLFAKSARLNLTVDLAMAMNRGYMALLRRGKKLLGMKLGPGVDSENHAVALDM